MHLHKLFSHSTNIHIAFKICRLFAHNFIYVNRYFIQNHCEVGNPWKLYYTRLYIAPFAQNSYPSYKQHTQFLMSAKGSHSTLFREKMSSLSLATFFLVFQRFHTFRIKSVDISLHIHVHLVTWWRVCVCTFAEHLHVYAWPIVFLLCASDRCVYKWIQCSSDRRIYFYKCIDIFSRNRWWHVKSWVVRQWNHTFHLIAKPNEKKIVPYSLGFRQWLIIDIKYHCRNNFDEWLSIIRLYEMIFL